MIRQGYYCSWCSPFFVFNGVILELIREILLGWHDSFVCGRNFKAWKATPLCIFWTIRKERNQRCFESEELSGQRLKNFFLNNFSLWVNVYIGRGYMPLVDFIDWPLLREGVFLCPFFFAYLLVLIVYDSYTFVCLLRYLIYSLIYKKKVLIICTIVLGVPFCT